MSFLFRWAVLRQDFKEVLADLLCIIAVDLADDPDGIRQLHMALCFFRFVFLPLFIVKGNRKIRVVSLFVAVLFYPVFIVPGFCRRMVCL